MEEELLEFIKRRFPLDNDWCNGNCYWFAAILQARASICKYKLDIVYDPIIGHFYAYDAKENVYYDWQGAHRIVQDSEFIALDKLIKEDPLWAKRLIHDCLL